MRITTVILGWGIQDWLRGEIGVATRFSLRVIGRDNTCRARRSRLDWAGPMDAKYCRDQAKRCLEFASAETNANIQARLFDIEQAWLSISYELELHEDELKTIQLTESPTLDLAATREAAEKPAAKGQTRSAGDLDG
jgi:hypothetical protein